MTGKAGWMFGGLLGMGLVAGCGGDGGGVVTNSTWRLWSDGTTSYATHTINGADGELDNIVECSFDGQFLRFGLVDSGLDENDVVKRPRSVIEVDASVDGSICNVSVRERAFGEMSPEPPEYRDTCARGCNVMFQDLGGGMISGQLRCTDMKINEALNPLTLEGAYDDASAMRNPMVFNFENCGG